MNNKVSNPRANTMGIILPKTADVTAESMSDQEPYETTLKKKLSNSMKDTQHKSSVLIED